MKWSHATRGYYENRLQFIRQQLANGLHLKEIAPQLGLTTAGLASSLYREVHRCGHATALEWVVAGIRKGEIK